LNYLRIFYLLDYKINILILLNLKESHLIYISYNFKNIFSKFNYSLHNIHQYNYKTHFATIANFNYYTKDMILNYKLNIYNHILNMFDWNFGGNTLQYTSISYWYLGIDLMPNRNLNRSFDFKNQIHTFNNSNYIKCMCCLLILRTLQYIHSVHICSKVCYLMPYRINNMISPDHLKHRLDR